MAVLDHAQAVFDRTLLLESDVPSFGLSLVFAREQLTLLSNLTF